MSSTNKNKTLYLVKDVGWQPNHKNVAIVYDEHILGTKL